MSRDFIAGGQAVALTHPGFIEPGFPPMQTVFRASFFGLLAAFSASQASSSPATSLAGLRLEINGGPVPEEGVEVLEPLRVVGTAPAGSALELRDGAGRAYLRREVDGSFDLLAAPGGRLGQHRVQLRDRDGGLLAEQTVRVDAHSGIRSDAGEYQRLWDELEAYVRGTAREGEFGGRRIRYYVSWLRDEVHVIKAARYWEPEPGGLVEHYLGMQTPEGILHDRMMRIGRDPLCLEVFGPRYSQEHPEAGLRYDRLPVEADLEYLAVEGVFHTWQASGDDAWMARQLPRLDRALDYVTSDPLRWSPEFGLVKRAYTIDTWDFKFFGFDHRPDVTGREILELTFNIHPGTPMCIMHGDNTGLYQAFRQMARMYAAVGDAERQAACERRAERIRTNLNRHAWNGRYYNHWVPVTPLELDQGGVDGARAFTLSNAYALNRGILDQAQGASIVREYQQLRETLRASYHAEWVAAYPAWPRGFASFQPGEYVNGGVLTIVAGELARGAFEYGYEAYAVDILNRLAGRLEERPAGDDGRSRRFVPLRTLTTPLGGACGHKWSGIPDNWGSAAVLAALMEGLGGLRDEATVFRHARIAPRWAATPAGEAAATARWGASDGYVAYRWKHDAAERRIRLLATGSGERFDFSVLLPAGMRATAVTLDGKPLMFALRAIEGSLYADFSHDGPLHGAIDIAYAPDA